LLAHVILANIFYSGVHVVNILSRDSRESLSLKGARTTKNEAITS